MSVGSNTAGPISFKYPDIPLTYVDYSMAVSQILLNDADAMSDS